MNIETVEFDTCSCGSNDDLVIAGISPIVQFDDGKLAWVVRCWNHDAHGRDRPTYYINDEARDELFGTGWRKTNADS